jgi:hypothetical protein
MFSKKRVTLTKLISYVLSFTEDNANKNVLESVFPTQIKSNDEFKFSCLKFGESKNINDFPDRLKTIFDPYIKDLLRHGSRKYFDNDINLSLYYSILVQIVKNFDKMPSKDQFNYISKLRDKLIMYISTVDIMKDLGYEKLGWIKKDLTNTLVQYKSNKLVMKLIADYLSLNIFVLNIVEDKIYVISDNDSYDIFRPNIFLSFNEDTFEPLVYSDSNILDYNMGPIKKLITVDKNHLILMDVNLKEHESIQFNIKLSNMDKYKDKIRVSSQENNSDESDKTISPKNDALKETVDIENEYNEVIPDVSDYNVYVKDIENTETEKTNVVDETPKLVFKISSKMKLEELQTIAKKLNISLDKIINSKKKAKTKNELIEEINNSLR